MSRQASIHRTSILNRSFVRPFTDLQSRSANVTIELNGAPSMQVGFYVNPTAGDINNQAAYQVFSQAMLSIGSTKNGFGIAGLPFTFQGSGVGSPLALDFNYPSGSQQQMTWATLYQLMQTCSSFYLASPQAPAKEVVFHMQSPDAKSWGEGKLVLSKPNKRKRRQNT